MSLLVYVLILALVLLAAGLLGTHVVPAEFRQIYYVVVVILVVLLLINALGGLGPRIVAI